MITSRESVSGHWIRAGCSLRPPPRWPASRHRGGCDGPAQPRATVTKMSDIRNPDPEPMPAGERMRRHRARQRGDDVPKVKPGPKPGEPETLRGASLEELSMR